MARQGIQPYPDSIASLEDFSIAANSTGLLSSAHNTISHNSRLFWSYPPRFISGFFCLFFAFLGRTHGIWKFPGQGSKWSCSCWPTPQSQQCQIQAVSAMPDPQPSERGQGSNLHPHGYQSGSSAVPQQELPISILEKLSLSIYLFLVLTFNIFSAHIPKILAIDPNCIIQKGLQKMDKTLPQHSRQRVLLPTQNTEI